MNSNQVDSLLHPIDFDQVCGSSPVPVTITRLSDGQFVHVNEAFIKLVEFSRDELIGHTSTELQLWSNSRDREETIQLLQRQEYVQNLPHEYRCKSGRIARALVSANIVDIGGIPCMLAFLTVVSELSDRQLSFIKSEKDYRALFDNMLNGLAYCRMLFENGQPRDFIYLSVNKAFGEITGLKDVIGRKVSEVVPGILKTNPELIATYGKVATSGESVRFETYISELKFWLTISVYRPEHGYFIAVFDNITERKLAEEVLRRKQNMLVRTENIAHVGSWEWDVATDTVTWSDELFRIFQLNPADGAPSFAEHAKLYEPHDMQRLQVAVEAAVKRGTPYELELRAVRKDGETRVCLARGQAEIGPDNRAIYLFGSLQDITERKKVEQEVSKLAFFDALTLLPNRRLLDDRLEQAIAASRRSGRFGAMLFLDLDNFKPLNDKHGHKAGDLLLTEVARRLSGCVREVDTVARFGGDEFVVVLSELDQDKSESISQANIIAKKIRAALAEPFWLTPSPEGSRKMIIHQNLGVSIGAVIFNKDFGSEDILRWADMAMYKAKEAGRNLIRFHDSGR